MAVNEAGTVTWYGLRIGPGMYGVFDTFEDEDGREAHMNGEIAAALMSKAPDLFSEALDIEKIDVLASK